MENQKTEKKDIITITQAAQNQLTKLLKKANSDSIGLRLSLTNKGCNGMSYKLDYANSKNDLDEEVVVGDVRLFVDPSATMFVIGTRMDWRQENLSHGFVFDNPNAQSVCGCGESFYVDKEELSRLKGL